jgi:hypothetical protein
MKKLMEEHATPMDLVGLFMEENCWRKNRGSIESQTLLVPIIIQLVAVLGIKKLKKRSYFSIPFIYVLEDVFDCDTVFKTQL